MERIAPPRGRMMYWMFSRSRQRSDTPWRIGRQMCRRATRPSFEGERQCRSLNTSGRTRARYRSSASGPVRGCELRAAGPGSRTASTSRMDGLGPIIPDVHYSSRVHHVGGRLLDCAHRWGPCRRRYTPSAGRPGKLIRQSCRAAGAEQYPALVRCRALRSTSGRA